MEEEKIDKINHIFDLLDVDFVQNFQDFFAKSMDVAIQSFNGYDALTEPSNFLDFCTKHMLSSPIGCKYCNDCLRKWQTELNKATAPVIFECHGGLTNFGIPILVKNKHLAYILGGKVLTESVNEDKFRALAKEIEVDEELFISDVKKLKVISIEKFRAITEAISIVINSIGSIAYANHKLSALGMDYKIPRNIAIEEWLFLNCENMKSPLTAREFEILKLIVMGKSNVEIAKDLFISVHTAKAHVSSILEKFGAEDRVQVAVKAIREGLV